MHVQGSHFTHKTLLISCSTGVQRAVRILEFVLDNEPKDGVALHLMGTIHQQRNNLDAAAESFRQGIKLSGVPVRMLQQ